MNDGLLSWPRASALDTFGGWPVGMRRVRPVVRQTAVRASGNTTSVILTPALVPASGNLLVAWISFSNFNQPGGRDCTPPAGWSALTSEGSSGNASFQAFYKWAAEGESSSYTFTISGTSENCSGVMAEVMNVDKTDPYSVKVAAGSTASQDVTRDRALLLCAWKYENAVTPAAIADWTLLENSAGSFHQAILEMRNDYVNAGTLISVTAPGAAAFNIPVWIYPPRPRLAG